VKGTFNGALLIDDYGHHPTEVYNTLKAIKNQFPDKRLVCVFQPHQYSRTHLLIEEFKGAFKYADKLIITDIYAARDTEEDMAKIDEKKLVKILSESGVDAIWGEGFDKTYTLLKIMITDGDVLVTMGAGNISNLAERLAAK
jgi:UDP-N-acetylmuramate--alanine ligase